MGLDTNTDVEEIDGVQDRNGDTRPAANADKQDRVAAALENQSSLTAGDYTTSGTSAENLPQSTVPDGVSVVLQAKNGNGGAVFVGDSNDQTIRLSAGQSITLAVDDLSIVHIQTPNSGDGVNYTHEG